MRDSKLARVEAARKRQDQPLGTVHLDILELAGLRSAVVRTAFFQEAIRKNGGLPLQLEAIQRLIKE
jgi:hypothetical protein